MKGAIMQVTISGRHLTVTPPIREYIEKKTSKFEKLNDSENFKVEVVVRHSRGISSPEQNHVEITGFFRDYKLRVEESSDDMYAAIDLATDRFERQLRKYKTRLLARRRTQEEVFKSAPGAEELELNPGEEKLGSIVRKKEFAREMMSEDEAILRMEMLGHDFFLFVLEDTDENAVVYRRDAGDYGLLRMGEELV